MNCEIISKIKSEVTSPIPSCRRDKVTSPIPSCRRGDNYRSRACTHSVLPLHGESEGVTRACKVSVLPLQGELEGVTRKGNFNY